MMATRSPLSNDPLGVLYPPARSPRRSPPHLCHERSPYACIPLPPTHGHDHGDRCHVTLTSIHPLLRSSSKSAIKFHLHNHPSSVAIPQHALAQPATHPPLPYLSLSTHLLPWSIVVLPSQPHLPHSFVTVSDVLHTLHHTLSLGATPEELSELTSDVRSQVEAAFERRVKSYSDIRRREWETGLGIRRIDILMGRTRFRGLFIVGDEKDVLVLDIR